MTSSPPTPGFSWTHKHDAYGTHQPVLAYAISQTIGPILELGCGFNSTHLIHTLAGDREVISLEHNADWISKFVDLNKEKRIVRKVNNWDDFMVNGHFGLVFVDHGDWISRLEALSFYKLSADVIVLHDSDYLQRELNVKFKDYYLYSKTWMPLQPYPYMTGPPTTAMSNYINVSEWQINYEDFN